MTAKITDSDRLDFLERIQEEGSFEFQRGQLVYFKYAQYGGDIIYYEAADTFRGRIDNAIRGIKEDE